MNTASKSSFQLNADKRKGENVTKYQKAIVKAFKESTKGKKLTPLEKASAQGHFLDGWDACLKYEKNEILARQRRCGTSARFSPTDKRPRTPTRD